MDMRDMMVDSPISRGNTSRYIGRLIKHPDISFRDQSILSSTHNDSTEIAAEEENSKEKTVFMILFRQFLEARQKFTHLESIFELTNEYEQLCSDYMTVMFPSTESADESISSIRDRSKALPKNMKQLLCRERDTWRLLRILYADRTKDELMDDINEETLRRRLSDRQVIEEFYIRNADVRQMQLVVDWLEQNELDLMAEEQYGEKIQFYSNRTIYWENTLHTLKTIGGSSFGAPLVNVKSEPRSDAHQPKHHNLVQSMDPDAPYRERKTIHSLDKEDEARLMRHIYRYLRAGRLAEGKRLAEMHGYNWLSAVLSGWLLQHNTYDDVEANENENPERLHVSLYTEGNPNRDLWKFVCWKLAEQNLEERSLYERAIFGALSGNVNEVLPLCNTWEDKLWAYFRCSIDVQIEAELKETIAPKQYGARKSGEICNHSRSNVQLPTGYWNNLRSPGEIFREVEATSVSEKKEYLFEEEHCFHQLQKFIVLNDIDAVFQVMIDWIRTHSIAAQSTFPNVVRFFVHLVLFCRELGLLESNETREHLAIEILQEYINYLIDQKEIELIAPYVACLPKTHQIASYARLLEFITDPQQQQLCLDLAGKACLDIELITKTVVESIRQQGQQSIEVDARSADINALESLTSLATFEDKRKIEALNWLFFNDVQYIELLLQSNSLMRDFILSRKVDAAKDVYLKLPSNLLLGINQEWKKQHPTEPEPDVFVRNAVQEHMCFQAYFQAHESIGDWMNLFYKCKPIEPKKLNSKKFTDRVAYDHQVKSYESELKHWNEMLGKQAIVTGTRIKGVLLFSNGNGTEWMCDPDRVESDDETTDESLQRRRQQMLQLRRLAIPQFVFTLQTILHSSNKLFECQQLINLVAGESWRLYAQFTPDQLRELLRKFHETCMSVLDQCPDALGFASN